MGVLYDRSFGIIEKDRAYTVEALSKLLGMEVRTFREHFIYSGAVPATKLVSGDTFVNWVRENEEYRPKKSTKISQAQ